MVTGHWSVYSVGEHNSSGYGHLSVYSVGGYYSPGYGPWSLVSVLSWWAQVAQLPRIWSLVSVLSGCSQLLRIWSLVTGQCTQWVGTTPQDMVINMCKRKVYKCFVFIIYVIIEYCWISGVRPDWIFCIPANQFCVACHVSQEANDDRVSYDD